VRRPGLTDLAIGALSNDWGGCGGAVNVGYLTEVSVRKVSMSKGEDFILSANINKAVKKGVMLNKEIPHSFQRQAVSQPALVQAS